MSDRRTEPMAIGREAGARPPYAEGLDLLLELLGALDEGLGRMVEQVRGLALPGEDPGLRGLVVTDAEVRRLLGVPAGPFLGVSLGEGGVLTSSLWTRVEGRVAAARKAGLVPPLEVLRERFGLSPFELDCLVTCLAPELDAKYEKLFGYLNDDVTRKYPSVQLLLRLLARAGETPIVNRRFLVPEATLLRAGLLAWVEDGRSPGAVSHLARCLRVEPAVVHFLLDEHRLDPDLERVWHDTDHPAEARDLWLRAVSRTELDACLESFLAQFRDRGERLVCILSGRTGSGRRYLVETACAARGLGLLALDCRRVLKQPQPELLLARAFRDSLLHASPLLLANAEVLVEDRERGPELRLVLEHLVSERGWLLFLTVDRRTALPRWFGRHRRVRLELPEPTRGSRRDLWRQVLTAKAGLAEGRAAELAEALAAKFRLTPGQIGEAFHRAAAGSSPPEGEGWWAALHRSAGEAAAPRLGELAQRLRPFFRWDDLVLPELKKELLRDIVRRVRFGRTVMEDWGFERCMNRGKGLNVLFSGPPGTGKTMAAEVIANELGMDLYRIDLASVVSKYIGETEKNLSRIFQEAEHADAILFFDEADALFGKRSEVRDAHDRYANIEINYLLQQMDGYEGIAILATNLRQNLDEAFLRRLHVAVEFPVPSPEDRREIWRKGLPAGAPLGEDVDLEFLARTFEIAGGNIRNICLAAAYLAAEEGGAITMGHLIRAVQREMEKIGKRTVREEFGAYSHLMESPAARQPALVQA